MPNSAAHPSHLLNRNFLLLFQGQLVSNLGNAVATAALIFWMKHAIGSASMMGALAACSAIPRIIFGMLGGTIADTYPRKTIIVVCDLFVGVLMLAATAIMTLAPERQDLIVAMFFMVAIGSGTASAFFAPAVMSAFPDLVPATRLQAANGFLQTSLMLAQLAGQALGGVAYRLLGAPTLLLVNGICYLVSAATESFIRIPTPPRLRPTQESAWQGFMTDTKAGFKYVVDKPGMLPLFSAMAGSAFFISPFGVLLPFYVEDTLNVSVDWFGYLMSGVAGGGLLGALIASWLPLGPTSRPRLIIGTMMAFPMSLIGLGLAPSPYAALGCIIFLGVASGLMGVVVMSTLQYVVPTGMRGRVMGLNGTMSAVCAPIALGLTGVLLDLVDHNTRLLFVAIGIGAMSVCVLLMFSAGFRELTGYTESSEGSPN